MSAPRAAKDVNPDVTISPGQPAPADRREPSLDPNRRGGPAQSFVRLMRRGISVFIERREPHLVVPVAPPAEDSLFSHARLSDWPKRGRRWLIVFAVGSLLFHVLLFAVLRFTLYGGGDDELAGALPVRLVLAEPQDKPPDPPKPPQQPEQQKQQQAQKPPPRGPLASDELGDPEATGDKPTATHAPAAGEVQPKPGEATPKPAANPVAAEQPKDHARRKPDTDPFKPDWMVQDTPLPTRQQVAAAGTPAPPPVRAEEQEDVSFEPTRKPSSVQFTPVRPGGAKRPNDRPDSPSHSEGHKAKYPGPDATRDEYLAYLRDLTDVQLARLPPAPFEGRPGVAGFQVLIRPNGSIVWFSLVHSSGYGDADSALGEALNGLQKFPPLPQELLNPDGTPVTLTVTLPLRLIPALAGGTR
jgi:hypothetical protein